MDRKCFTWFTGAVAFPSLSLLQFQLPVVDHCLKILDGKIPEKDNLCFK